MKAIGFYAILLTLWLAAVSAVLIDVPGYATIEGDTGTSFHTKRTFYRFRGLHYAEEPTPLTRYLPPVPYTPEPGTIIDGTRIPPACSQTASLSGGVEDCLLVNVFTTLLPGESDPSKLLPVIYWIHGGAFSSGSTITYPADKFMDKDVVLVIVQYRLGPLGFLSLNTDDVPGNAGIFDQIEGLRWTNKFIQYFGGDPNLITLAGESAGSASVSMLMLAPQARGLFHRVIGESGSMLSPWAIDREPVKSAMRVAEIAGCPMEPYESLLDCLRNIPADFITAAYSDYFSELLSQGQFNYGGSAPVIQVAGAQRALEREPLDLFETGEYATEVPIMFGTNKQEGSFFLGVLYNEYLLPNNLTENTDYLKKDVIADLFKSVDIQDETGDLTQEAIDKYLVGAELGNLESMIPGMIDLYSVIFMKESCHQTAMLHSKFNPSTYWYSFEFLGRNSFWNAYFTPPRPPMEHGVAHADELIYLFSVPTFGNNATEAVLSQKMLDVWTTFAKYGNPTPDGVEMMEGIPNFPAATVDDDTYMSIDTEWSVQYNFSLTYTVTVDELNP